MKEYLERSKEYWVTASKFPLNKEEIYPEHSQVQEFDLHHDKSIVEYGCGAGSDTLSYLRRGNHVAFCDVVPENIETTKKNVEEAGFEIGQGCFEGNNGFACPIYLTESDNIPLVAASWDIVSSHGVLHHIPDPVPVVKEFHRILKPDGLLYVMLYTEHALNYFLGTVAALQMDRKISREEAFGWCMDGEGTPYARAYTEAEGWDLLDQCGFKIEKVTMFNNNFFRTYKGIKV